MNSHLLLPYETIHQASLGDAIAINEVLRHFDKYINKLATQVVYGARENTYYAVNDEVKSLLQAKLVCAILKFKAE